jgi:ubiquinone/menaquinone biosynthesis C-methylase UbiE
MDEQDANREAIEAWNTILFDKFCRFRKLLTTGLAIHGDRAIQRHKPARGARVLDLGCGFGDTTITLGRIVGETGAAVGVDAAPRFIDVAQKDAAAAGLKQVSFEVADIQFRAPTGPFDLAFSRMGTMFLASPVAAFRQVRKVLAPGGVLCFAVWRKREDNPCFTAAEPVVHELLGHPSKGDQVTCGPGPFSQASADVVSDQLLAAGYEDIVFERSDGPVLIGENLDHAVEFAMALGPPGEVIRLAGEAALKMQDRVEAAVREVLAPYARPDGVCAPSSAWIVSARVT